jgi:putative ABC transport system permease protein
MRAGDIVTLAFETLRLHRLRTGLTVTAVAVGATAVLLLTALGDAAKRYVVDQFAAIGTNLIMVRPGRTETAGMVGAAGTATRDLTLDDAEAIRRRSPSARAVAPVSLGTSTFEYGGRDREVYVVGTTPALFPMRGLEVAAGRALPEGDPRRGDYVVVIGSRLAREVFGAENPLGRSVRIARAHFRVIGLLKPKGSVLGVDYDDICLVPVGIGMRLFNQSNLFYAMVQASDAAAVPQVVLEARAVILERHRDEDFTIITQDSMLQSFQAILNVLTLALAGIAAISLAVAGIGIMNVMLVSVSERVGEIGLLKALGARPRQIAALFLVEALALSAAGAIAGLVFGVALSFVAARLFPVLELVPSPMWMGFITALALAVGGVFGLIPARRAAGLEPVEALRRKA